MLTKRFDPLKGEMLQIMDAEGRIVAPELKPDLSDERVLELYKVMLLTRAADTKALQLQRQGRMLTYAPNTGQEAAQVGSAAVLRETDWLVPAFRELGAWLVKGVSLEHIYLYWYGNEWGSHFPENVRMLPISIPIALS